MTGRKPVKLPENCLLYLHSEGYSPLTIAYILHKELNISISRYTIWRRLKALGVNFKKKNSGIK